MSHTSTDQYYDTPHTTYLSYAFLSVPGDFFLIRPRPPPSTISDQTSVLSYFIRMLSYVVWCFTTCVRIMSAAGEGLQGATATFHAFMSTKTLFSYSLCICLTFPGSFPFHSSYFLTLR